METYNMSTERISVPCLVRMLLETPQGSLHGDSFVKVARLLLERIPHLLPFFLSHGKTYVLEACEQQALDARSPTARAWRKRCLYILHEPGRAGR
jgi:hypothetical protein